MKRPQIIKMYASCKDIKYGVPQGSDLGTLLFLWSINNLPQALQEAKVMFIIYYRPIPE
jgi:hypothetical protein